MGGDWLTKKVVVVGIILGKADKAIGGGVDQPQASSGTDRCVGAAFAPTVGISFRPSRSGLHFPPASRQNQHRLRSVVRPKKGEDIFTNPDPSNCLFNKKRMKKRPPLRPKPQ